MIIADLVVTNGKVITVDKDFSLKEAIAVKNGWVIDVGTNSEIKSYIGQGTEVIDLEGKVILPGAHDGHIHTTHSGFFLDPDKLNLKFPEVKSIKDINKKLADAVRKSKPGEWIIGFGWNSGLLEECVNEKRTVNRWDFDPITPNNPIALYDYSAHVLAVNSKALEICGITKDTPDLKREEGRFSRDKDTSEPDGCFYEWGAQLLISRHMPQLNKNEIKECIKRAQTYLNENGITSHADILGVGGEYLFCGTWGSKVIDVYEEMARDGKLTARVSINVMPGINGIQGYEAITEGLKITKLPEFHDKNWVKADTVKIFADGSPSLDNTYVFHGDTEEEQRQELIDTIIEVHRQGWQAAVHTTGDKAAEAIIEGCIKAQQMYPREAPRHFLIHGDWLTMERAKKAAKFKIGLSAQPNAGYSVMDFLVELFGRERGSKFFCLQDLTKAGINVAGGSDANIFDPNWRLGVQFAVTRKTITGNVYAPEIASTIENAIKMYTINGAYQEHMENIRGSIEVNKVADFQVLGEDIFKVNKDEIGSIPVVMTICDGKIVYNKL